MNSSLTESAETAALLDQATAGQTGAVDRLFDRHLRRVRLSVRRRVRPGIQARFDPSDIVQEAQWLARRQLSKYLAERPMPFALWLLKLAHQRLVDFERFHWRARRRSVVREIPLPDESSMLLMRHMQLAETTAPSEAAVQREHAQLVRRCLAQLPQLDREILMLRVFDGLKNLEVATLLNVAPETTKKRFTRALLRLKTLLRGAGVE